MSSAVGLLIVSVAAGIVVAACFIQDAFGSLKFWRAR
jgi:hypothetical protein